MMVTGSNCCNNDWFHWYRLNSDFKVSKRYTAEITLPKTEPRLRGKTENRPFLLDWDRDGDDDLAVALVQETKTENNQYHYTPRIFINTDFAKEAHDVSLTEKQKNKEPETSGFNIDLKLPFHLTSVPATDLLESVHIVDNDEQFSVIPVDLRKTPSEKYASIKQFIEIKFAFGDYDNDGNFDILFARNSIPHVSSSRSEEFRYQHKSCALFWMRNRNATGQPDFEPPKRIHLDSDKIRQINSLSIADFNGDGKSEIIASVYEGVKQNPVRILTSR